MKFSIQILVLGAMLFAGACNQKSDKHDHDHNAHGEQSTTTDDPNQALYDEVMAVHDEVMPKMNDLYKAKTALKTRLELPGTSDTEKQEINNKLASIDSASEGMMIWMRQFKPLPHTANQDSARLYLEKELVKVNQIKEDILAALQE